MILFWGHIWWLIFSTAALSSFQIPHSPHYQLLTDDFPPLSYQATPHLQGYRTVTFVDICCQVLWHGTRHYPLLILISTIFDQILCQVKFPHSLQLQLHTLHHLVHQGKIHGRSSTSSSSTSSKCAFTPGDWWFPILSSMCTVSTIGSAPLHSTSY